MSDHGPLAAGSTFTLRLKVLPDAIPGAIRTRRALKALLRFYGLRNLGFAPDIAMSNPDAADVKPDAGNSK